MTGARRRLVAGGAAAALTLTLTSCSLGNGLYNTTLPGGADLGSHPYSVTAQFSDVLDLVPQAGVKVNDVAVGRVSSIDLDRTGKIANVVVKINGSVHLPANAVATIQQTSLLGEKYVALGPPSQAAPEGTLHNGATIDETRTSTGVEVEQVFGALSLLLNGGGIGQLHEISQELNETTHGHESDFRTFLAKNNQVVTQLNRRKDSITRTLDALNNLGAALRRNNTQIAQVLHSLSPGLAVIANQRRQLRDLLVAIDGLSTTTVSVLKSSRRDIVADLRSLSPIIGQLANAGAAFPRSLQVLLTYPFSNGAVDSIKGDFLNSFVRNQLNTPANTICPVTGPCRPISGATTTTEQASSDGSSTAATPPSGLLPATSSAGPGLPSTVPLTNPKSTTSPATRSSASPSATSSNAGAR